MKKLLGKLLIGLFCIGMLASCGSDEDVTEATEEAVTRMEVSEEKVEPEEDAIELSVSESEEETNPRTSGNCAGCQRTEYFPVGMWNYST